MGSEVTRRVGARSDLLGGYGAKEMPLPQYATLVGIFAASLGAFFAGATIRRTLLPERLGFGDVVLIGVATHKLSRLISKDRVTSPFRAPFARFEKSAGPAKWTSNRAARECNGRSAI